MEPGQLKGVIKLTDLEEDVEKLKEQVDNNTIELTKITSNWKTNKELYELIQHTQKEINELNKNINRYNGLIEERKKDRKLLNKLHERVECVEAKEEAKEEQLINWREWSGWIIATALGVMKMMEIWG